MFDTVSVDKITSAPRIDGLDIERLPEYLTEMYTKIVDLRINYSTFEKSSDETRYKELLELWKLAHTYSALSIGGKLEKKEKTGAAFVAANAFSMIWLANNLNFIDFTSINNFTDVSISPIILSSILFVIAEQPADAVEICEKMNLKLSSLSSRDVLEQAIFHLIKGSLNDISKLPETDTADLLMSQSYDLELIAYSVLWDKIIKAIRILSDELLGKNDRSSSHWREILLEVKDLSINKASIDKHEIFNSYSTPFHLASLLLILGEELVEKAITNVHIPEGIDSQLWKGYLKSVAYKRPYLWKNHYDAIIKGFLTPGTSSVISFPTGAGKSTITELKIASTLLRGKSSIYLTPTNSLVDQVERDLRKSLQAYFTKDNLISQLFNQDLSDSKANDFIRGSVIEDNYFFDFDENIPSITVMTPERCLSVISTNNQAFNNIGLIVFDECHLLHGGGEFINRRGIDAMFALTSLLSIPKEKPDILLASAMIENGDILSEWIAEIVQRECLSLDLRWKPTRQARGCVIYNHDRVEELKKLIEDSLEKTTTKSPPSALKRELSIIPECLFCLKQTWNTESSKDYTKMSLMNNEVLITASGKRPFWNLTANRNQVAAKIGQFFSDMGIKTLIFADSPKNANSISVEAAKCISDEKRVAYQKEDFRLIEICKAEIGADSNIYLLENNKTACHHGLLLLSERRLAEQTFKRNSENGINLLSATPTLAQGMNLPVEIVILAGDDRYDKAADNRELLKAHELLNASGRAGRAGWIATGMVILIPSEIIAIKESEDGITLDSHWFKLRELIYSHEDQCLEIIDPFELCLDAIQRTSENNSNQTDYFLQRLPKLYDKSTSDFLKNSFGFYKAKKNNLEIEYLAKIAVLDDIINNSDNKRYEEWIENISSETGVQPVILAEIDKYLEDLNYMMNTEELIDSISNWFIDNSIYRNTLIPVNDLIEIFWKKRERENIEYSQIIDKMKTLITLWMNGQSITEMAKWLGDNGEKCKKIRRFIIRLLPNISFAFGLFPLIAKKKNEINDEILIPSSLGSLAGCIRDGFNCPEKLAMYQIIIKKELTSRVLIHKKYEELNITDHDQKDIETYDDLYARISKLL